MTKEVQTSETAEKKSPLHPVYSVTNINTKVRTLDGEKVTYASWTKLFKLQAKGFKVSKHIDGTLPPAETDPEYENWIVIDAIVLQWIYNTISDKLLARIIKDESTALQAWNKIRDIFLNNKASRQATLEHQLNNLTLSACASFDAYCEKLKEIADQLDDIEEPVSESRLVLQLVRGLPTEYNVAAAMINQSPTTWDEARNKIQLEQDRLQAQTKTTQTVLAAPSQQSQQQPSSHHSQNPNNNSYQQQPHNQYRGRGRGRGRGGGRGYRGRGSNNWNGSNNGNGWNNGGNWNGNNNGSNNSGYTNGWNNGGNNWNGSQQNWNGPPPCPHPAQPNWNSPWTNKQSNGPPPGFPAQQQQQQAHMAFDGQQTGPNPLCPTELGAALQTMNLNQQDTNWYMDTGASSHLTANPGSYNWNGNFTP